MVKIVLCWGVHEQKNHDPNQSATANYYETKRDRGLLIITAFHYIHFYLTFWRSNEWTICVLSKRIFAPEWPKQKWLLKDIGTAKIGVTVAKKDDEIFFSDWQSRISHSKTSQNQSWCGGDKWTTYFLLNCLTVWLGKANPSITFVWSITKCASELLLKSLQNVMDAYFCLAIWPSSRYQVIRRAKPQGHTKTAWDCYFGRRLDYIPFFQWTGLHLCTWAFKSVFHYGNAAHWVMEYCT